MGKAEQILLWEYLKPCPFCGGEAKIMNTKITCINPECGANILMPLWAHRTAIICGMPSFEVAKEGAIKAWNTRGGMNE